MNTELLSDCVLPFQGKTTTSKSSLAKSSSLGYISPFTFIFTTSRPTHCFKRQLMCRSWSSLRSKTFLCVNCPSLNQKSKPLVNNWGSIATEWIFAPSLTLSSIFPILYIYILCALFFNIKSRRG